MPTPDPWAPLRSLRADLPWDGLTRLAAELVRWNRSIRLLGPRDPEGVALQIADALAPFLLEPPEFPLLDVGTGPGLPLLPLALAYPDRPCAGIEPRAKRVAFLRHAVRLLGLDRVAVHQGRVPEILEAVPSLAGAFPTVTMRAVAPPGRALELARPFLAPGGRAFLLLGPDPAPSVPGWELLTLRPCPPLQGFGPRSLAVFAPRSRERFT